VEEPVDESITIDDFAKIKLRTAVVLEAERVPKSEKLLKLQVDLGTERRQILAGIAKHYAPEDLIGATIVVVANLKPAKLMGMESQGMVLAASNANGVLTLVMPKDPSVGPGAEVR
jgi:methionyl-tRNA synthetase